MWALFKRHERRLVRLEYSFILFRVKITKLLPTSDDDVKLKQGKCTERNQGQMNDALYYTTTNIPTAIRKWGMELDTWIRG